MFYFMQRFPSPKVNIDPPPTGSRKDDHYRHEAGGSQTRQLAVYKEGEYSPPASELRGGSREVMKLTAPAPQEHAGNDPTTQLVPSASTGWSKDKAEEPTAPAAEKPAALAAGARRLCTFRELLHTKLAATLQALQLLRVVAPPKPLQMKYFGPPHFLCSFHVGITARTGTCRGRRCGAAAARTLNV